MLFEDFTAKLARQQLKATNAVDSSKEGLILCEFEDQILDITNQGLTDISTRMKLFEGRDVITFVDGQNVYDLSGLTDFVKPLEFYDENECKYQPRSNAHITLPSPTTVRFSTKFMEDKTAVDVLFHASHPEISITDEILLPKHLIEALALYVSGLYLSHMAGPEHTQKGDSYYGLYLNMLTTDEVRNTSGTSEVVDEDTRFT
ncbi:virion structural protein, partial [Roseobacter phage RD-1410W1-01]